MAMILSVVTGLLLPALYGGWQTLRERQREELEGLSQEQRRMADTLALALSSPLWNLNVHDIRQLASSIMRDPRVLRIRIEDDLAKNTKIYGANVVLTRAQPQRGTLLTVERPILHGSDLIGHIRLEMDTGLLEARLARSTRQFMATAGTELAVSLLLILFLLNQRFVRPLRQLQADSAALAQRRFKEPFAWQRGDELGELGQSLETTRQALAQAFSEIEDKTYALEADITHRKQVEMALRESEGRFRSLLELSSDGYWEQDSEYRFTRINSNAYRDAGFDQEENIGRTRWELPAVCEPDEAGWQAHRELIEARLPFRGFEYGRVNPAGELRYFSVSGEPIYDAQGDFRGYRGTVQNISARKQAEAALRQALLEQQNLLDNALVGIEFLKGRIIERCNRGREEMLGYGPGELIGQPASIYYASDEDYEVNMASSYWAMSLGRPATGEVQLVRKDGRRIWCSYHGKPLDPRDPSREMIWVYQDISERKLAEQALRESEERFRKLTLLSADWYWETDENGRFTLLSPNFQQSTGVDPALLLGRTRGEQAGAHYNPDAWLDYQARIAMRAPFYDLEYRLDEGPFGQRIGYGSDSGEPMFDADGSFRGYRGIGRDLTAMRVAEKAQKSEIRLRRLVEHLPTGAIYVEQNRLLLNKAAEELTGYSRDEMRDIEQWFSQLFGEHASRHRAEYEADREAGFPAPRVLRIRRKDDEPRVIEFAGFADPYGEVWLAHDVTQREAAQEALRQALLEQQVILDNALIGIAFVRERRISRCNRGLETIYGYAGGELQGESTRVFYSSEEEFQAFGAAAYPLIAAGQTFSGESSAVRKDGATVWVSLQGKAVDPSDPDTGIVWVIQDITARKDAERALSDAKLQLEAGVAELEHINGDLMLLSELSGMLQACQSVEEAQSTIGAYGAELFPQDAGVFFIRTAADNTLQAVAQWGSQLQFPKQFTAAQCWALRRGQVYQVERPEVELSCAHVEHAGGHAHPYVCIPMVAQGETLGMLYLEYRQGERTSATRRLALALAEQTALALANIQLRQTLRQQSIRDALTGLYNRRYLEEALQRELARATRKRGGFAVAVVDVDHFKQFNDTFGHDVGDLVLKEVATLLQDSVREGDIACRLGGEEFVLLLSDITPDTASQLAGRVLTAVRTRELSHNQRQLGRITVSLGLAFYPLHGESGATLLESADGALYQAKRSGRDRYVVAESG
jgi:diguanylate cyclase (GGDEF)-like protein/PAS domain S-box-containing protein